MSFEVHENFYLNNFSSNVPDKNEKLVYIEINAYLKKKKTIPEIPY